MLERSVSFAPVPSSPMTAMFLLDSGTTPAYQEPATAQALTYQEIRHLIRTTDPAQNQAHREKRTFYERMRQESKVYLCGSYSCATWLEHFDFHEKFNIESHKFEYLSLEDCFRVGLAARQPLLMTSDRKDVSRLADRLSQSVTVLKNYNDRINLNIANELDLETNLGAPTNKLHQQLYLTSQPEKAILDVSNPANPYLLTRFSIQRIKGHSQEDRHWTPHLLCPHLVQLVMDPQIPCANRQRGLAVLRIYNVAPVTHTSVGMVRLKSGVFLARPPKGYSCKMIWDLPRPRRDETPKKGSLNKVNKTRPKN